MSANLKTKELGDLAVVLLKAADGTWGWTPKIIQTGDLQFYPRTNTLSDDCPLVLVKPLSFDIGIPTLDGEEVDVVNRFRVVAVDIWATGDVFIDEKIERAEDVAQTFIGTAAYDWNLDEAISGYQVTHAFPTSVELEPPEDLAVQQLGQIFAVAVNFEVYARTQRTGG